MQFAMAWLVSDWDKWDTGILGYWDEWDTGGNSIGTWISLINELIAHAVHNKAGNSFSAHF
jgi:hypothetical protein